MADHLWCSICFFRMEHNCNTSGFLNGNGGPLQLCERHHEVVKQIHVDGMMNWLALYRAAEECENIRPSLDDQEAWKTWDPVEVTIRLYYQYADDAELREEWEKALKEWEAEGVSVNILPEHRSQSERNDI